MRPLHFTSDRPRTGVRPRLTVDDYVDGVLAGHRAIIGRAISLVESRNPQHQREAQEILLRLLPHTGKAQRVGISGVPGAGKSTFIEAFGCNLTGNGHKVAVLAVDPSSSRTGGSILGDKTRMARLAAETNAFIRPSPSSCTLGGVTRTTRETMVVCEAAGYDVILVETVGTGQSETMVADMVDFFLVVMVSGTGDELQGIKKGILEIADMIAVNKADGDNIRRAKLAAKDLQNALHIMTPASPNWTPPVLTCSAVENTGLDAIWEKIGEHRSKLLASGEYQERRRQQRLHWMWGLLDDRLMSAFRTHPKVMAVLPTIERTVLDGNLTPTLAVGRLFDAFGMKIDVFQED